MKGTETGQLRCLVFLCTTRRCRNDFLVGLEKVYIFCLRPEIFSENLPAKSCQATRKPRELFSEEICADMSQNPRHGP